MSGLGFPPCTIAGTTTPTGSFYNSANSRSQTLMRRRSVKPASARASRFAGSLPFIGVTPDTQAGVEASYEALLTDLDAHFAQFDFLFGSRPSIGDYGLIGPLYAHQYRDPASGALMEAHRTQRRSLGAQDDDACAIVR